MAVMSYSSCSWLGLFSSLWPAWPVTAFSLFSYWSSPAPPCVPLGLCQLPPCGHSGLPHRTQPDASTLSSLARNICLVESARHIHLVMPGHAPPPCHTRPNRCRLRVLDSVDGITWYCGNGNHHHVFIFFSCLAGRGSETTTWHWEGGVVH